MMEGNHPIVATTAARVQRLLDAARGSEVVEVEDFGTTTWIGGSAGLSPMDIREEDEILVAALAACGRLVWSEERWAWMLPSES